MKLLSAVLEFLDRQTDRRTETAKLICSRLQNFVTDAQKVTVFTVTNRRTLGREHEYPTLHNSSALKEERITFSETTLSVYQATRYVACCLHNFINHMRTEV